MESINRSTTVFDCRDRMYRKAYVGGFSKVDTQFDAGGIYDIEVRDVQVPIDIAPEVIARIGQRDAVLLTLAFEEKLNAQDLELVNPDEGTERWEKKSLLKRIFGQATHFPKTFSSYGPEMFEQGFAHACHSLFDVNDFAADGHPPAEDLELDGGGFFAEGYLHGHEVLEALLDEWDGHLENLDAARRRVVEHTHWY